MDNALYSCRHGLEDNVERRLKEFAGAFLGVSPEEAWRQRNEALFVDGVPAYVEGSAYMGSVAMKSLLARFKTALESFDMTVIDEVSGDLQGFTKFSDVGETLENILQDAFVGNYKRAVARTEEMLASFA